MKTLLIINPYSAGGKSAAAAKKLMEYLNGRNYPFDHVEIKHFDDAYNYSFLANRSGIDNIVAVGGDGTINKVLNGFFDNCGNKISSSRFGVVHTGTSPDFCKSYNIPTDVQKATEVIINQHITNVPVGMIKFKSTPPENKVISSKTMYFACCANIGLGAALARSANSGIRAYIGDFLGTLTSFIKIILNYRGTDYEALINGREEKLKNMINISAGITKYIASGINIYRDEAVPADQFYILKVPEVKLLNIPKLIKLIYSGRQFSNSPVISMEYARRVEISGNLIHPEVEFDGDPAGFLPCTIEMAKDKLPVFTN